MVETYEDYLTSKCLNVFSIDVIVNCSRRTETHTKDNRMTMDTDDCLSLKVTSSMADVIVFWISRKN